MHWLEYLMKAGELALFMLWACAFMVLLEHPSSAVHQAVDSATLRPIEVAAFVRSFCDQKIAARKAA